MSGAPTADENLMWEHLTKPEFKRMRQYCNEYWSTRLKPTTAKVLSSLIRHTDYETGTCCPSVDLLAKETGKCVRTVRYALKELEDAPLIVVLRQRERPGVGIVRHYTPYSGSTNYLVQFQIVSGVDMSILLDPTLDFLTLFGKVKIPPGHIWHSATELSPKIMQKVPASPRLGDNFSS